MKLLTKELIKQFEKTGRQEGKNDPLVIAKYFCPWTQWTWFATEYDKENDEFFWVIDGHEKERGCFTHLELISILWPHGLRIERDLYFEPTSCSELGLPIFNYEEEQYLDEYDPCMIPEMQYASWESKYAF